MIMKKGRNMRISKAKARVLTKAHAAFVMISGEFSGIPDKQSLKTKNFDRRRHIEELYELGLLVHGDGFNQFVCSKFGRQIVEKLPPSLRFNLDELTEEAEKNDEATLL
jgi:hypothetical protein